MNEFISKKEKLPIKNIKIEYSLNFENYNNGITNDKAIEHLCADILQGVLKVLNENKNKGAIFTFKHKDIDGNEKIFGKSTVVVERFLN